MEVQTPKLLKLDRRTLAVMNTTKTMLDSLATSSAGATVLSAVGTLVNEKYSAVVPVVTGLLTAVSLLARAGLSYVASITQIKNPLKDD